VTVEAHWNELVTTALLGTDRRSPPEADGLLGDLVADTVRIDPSSRMLAHVAACTAIRRAGVQPAAPIPALIPAPSDDRPVCVPAAAERWHHVITSWPVLEDEWMLTLIGNGWRTAPELVPAMLQRHRRDPIRRARVAIAAGPIAQWLVEHLPELAIGDGRIVANLDPEQLGELPSLPIPPELSVLLDRGGAEIGGSIAVGLEDRTLAEAHRAVLVNLIARCAPGALVDLADVLDSVDPMSPGRGLVSVLADLATTRRRMLDELT
jgi:hypothetical protein